MTTSKGPSLDLDEFVRLLHGELEFGVVEALKARPKPGPLEITGLRVRFGVAAGEAGPDAEPAPTIEDPLLPSDRPWEVELRVAFDGSGELRRAGEQELVEVIEGRRAPSPFDGLKVEAIQGVGPQTAKRLARRGVKTLAQLAEIDGADLGAEPRLLELRTKARLARTPIPALPPSLADSSRLLDLVASSPEELHELLGRQVASLARCRRLAAHLAVLMVVLDDRELAKLRLRDLFPEGAAIAG